MTDKEYEQKKHECWEQFCRHIVDEEEEFYNMFDRAYALGKQEKDVEGKEELLTCKRSEVLWRYEEAVGALNDNKRMPPELRGFENGKITVLSVLFGPKCLPNESSKSFKVDDRVLVKETNRVGVVIDSYPNDVGYCVYFDDGDGCEDAEYAPDQLELYKKTTEPKDAEETVISGWVFVDDITFDRYLRVYKVTQGDYEAVWDSGHPEFCLGTELYPDMTPNSDPEPIEIIIKRKKK